MSRKVRYKMRENDSEYNKGFTDGLQASFDSSELDAYYAGVGYGKAIAKNKRLGFNSEEERLEFEKGMRNRNNHFHAYRARKPNIFERIFFPRDIAREKGMSRFKEDRKKRVDKRIEKQRDKTLRKKQRNANKYIRRTKRPVNRTYKKLQTGEFWGIKRSSKRGKMNEL